QYRTDYRTEQVPVVRVVSEQVPVTQVQTQYRTDYRTEQVPVVRVVSEQVPVTQMQTQYRTDYRTESYVGNRPVTEIVQVPRTVTVMTPVPQTTYQQRICTVMRQVLQTSMVNQPTVVNQPVTVTRQVVEWVNNPSAQAVASDQSAAPSPQTTAAPQQVVR